MQTFTSPSGRTYTWEKDTPPTEADIAAMVEHDKMAGPAAPVDQPTAAPKGDFRPDIPMMVGGLPVGSLPTSVLGGPSDAKRAKMPQQWANSDVLDRLKLMAKASPDYAVSSNIGTAQMGANMAAPAVGATVGGAIGSRMPLPAISAPIGRFAGGAIGDLAAQQMGRSAAEAQGQQPQPMQYGRALGTGISSVFGGPSLADASIKKVAAVGAGYGAANLAGKAVETAVDDRRLPTLGEGAKAFGMGAAGAPMAAALDSGSGAMSAKTKAAQGAETARILKTAQDNGFVIPPSLVNGSFLSSTAESYAGKAATLQQAIHANQPITNQLVRDELNLPEKTTFNEKTFETLNAGPDAVYARVAGMSPQASILLDQYKDSKGFARNKWNLYENTQSEYGGRPDIKKEAERFDAQTSAILGQLKTEAKATGNGNLMDAFKEAEKKKAQIALVKDNTVGGNVSASAFSNPEKYGLTGNFKVIGDFYDTFERAMRDVAKTPAPGPNQLGLMAAVGASGSLGAYGVAQFGPAGAALGMVPAGLYAGKGAMRDSLLSPSGQQRFAQPNYGPTSLDVPASLARFGTANAGRQPIPQQVPSMMQQGAAGRQSAPAGIGNFAQPNPNTVPLMPSRSNPSNDDNKKELERIKRLNQR